MNRPEEALQRQVASFLWLVDPVALWTHVPNQRANRTQAAILKAMGVKAGWADLTFLMPTGAKVERGVIELKAPRGKLSDAQLDFFVECRETGVPWALCRSVVEVDATLRSWGVVYRNEPAGLSLELGEVSPWAGATRR